MNIKAKMKCTNVTKHDSGEVVSFEAVVSGSEENKSFSAATPSASLTMNVSNPVARGAFEVGKEYYLDFAPVE